MRAQPALGEHEPGEARPDDRQRQQQAEPREQIRGGDGRGRKGEATVVHAPIVAGRQRPDAPLAVAWRGW